VPDAVDDAAKDAAKDAAEETVEDADLQRPFVDFSTTAMPRAPLYAALSHVVARDPELSRLLEHAPATQRLPVLLFACVHELLLEQPADELAQWYPNLTSSHRDPNDDRLEGMFRSFVASNLDRLALLLGSRTTQTNEVGRCGFLLPALGLLADDVGALGVLDVGASGGLNLLLDHYEYRYRSAAGTTQRVGGPSAVRIDVETTGAVPVPTSMPTIVARCGVDRQPIDVTRHEEARWLEACVWPDQAERFHRLVAAIDIAREHPPEVLRGDAVTALATGIERVGASAHPVVTNSWVLNYLTSRQRIAYLDELERIGHQRDLSWVYAEAPDRIPELPVSPDPKGDDRTVLTMVRWRRGQRIVEHLATVHPHGFWMHWR
jgi:hypothetical protein